MKLRLNVAQPFFREQSPGVVDIAGVLGVVEMVVVVGAVVVHRPQSLGQ